MHQGATIVYIVVDLSIRNSIFACGSGRAEGCYRVTLIRISTLTFMEGKAVNGFTRLNYQSGKVVTVRTVLIAIAALTSMNCMPRLGAGV